MYLNEPLLLLPTRVGRVYLKINNIWQKFNNIQDLPIMHKTGYSGSEYIYIHSKKFFKQAGSFVFLLNNVILN